MICLLTGNEPYRIKCETDRIKKEYGDLGTQEFEALSEDVFEACGQPCLFVSKKAVIVHMSGLPDTETFMTYVKHPAAETDLYLADNGLDKRSAIFKTCKAGKYGVELRVLDKVPLDKFLAVCGGMMKRRGCVVRESTLRKLYDYTGYGVNEDCNLFDINTVIKQMCYQAGEGGEVKAEMVEQFATAYEDAVVWQLSDTLFSGDRKMLMTLGEQLLKDGENPIAMLSALLRQFRLAFKAKVIGGSEKELSKALGVQVYHLHLALSYDEKVLSKALGRVQKRVNDIKDGQEPVAVFRMALMETQALFQEQSV